MVRSENPWISDWVGCIGEDGDKAAAGQRLTTVPNFATLSVGPSDPSIRPMPNQRMAAAELEVLLRVALSPLNLALRKRYLKVRRLDPDAAAVAAEELAIVDRIRVCLVRQGWWN